MILQGNHVVSDWRETLQVRQPGFQFTNAFRDGYWDGYVRPGRLTVNGNYYKLVIGRGLLNNLRDYLQVNDLPAPKYKLGYDPSPTPLIEKIDDDVWETLRDYQQESLLGVVNNRWGRVALATNAGKGAVIALTAEILTPHKTLILADEISVFQALEEELTKWTNCSIGLVEGGQKKIPKEDIVLGMAPTISNRVTSKDKKVKKKWSKWLLGFKCVLLDEADRATSKTWTNILYKTKNSEFRVGFSGSFPDKGTVADVKLEETIGPELIKVRNMELVERGISARPKVEVYEYKFDAADSFTVSSDFHEVYRDLVVTNDVRNQFVQKLLLDGQQNAVVVDYIQHGEILNELIDNSVFLRGQDSKNQRLETLQAFQRGEFQNLIVTSILDRGSNLLGFVKCLVFASGSGSDRQVLQRIGRGLRRGDGKENIIIRDVYDYGHDFLVNASERRMDVYKDEDFDIEVISL